MKIVSLNVVRQLVCMCIEKENQEELETKRRGHRWSRKHGFASEVM